MRPPRDPRPRFLLDQNFPAATLSAASLDKWLLEIEILASATTTLAEVVITGLASHAELQAEGFVYRRR